MLFPNNAERSGSVGRALDWRDSRLDAGGVTGSVFEQDNLSSA